VSVDLGERDVIHVHVDPDCAVALARDLLDGEFLAFDRDEDAPAFAIVDEPVSQGATEALVVVRPIGRLHRGALEVSP